jgi:hypothetical protein
MPGRNAMQAVALTREVIPVLTAKHVIGPIQEFFPELDATQVVGLIWEFLLELDRINITGLIRRIECPTFKRVMNGLFRNGLAMKKVKV